MAKNQDQAVDSAVVRENARLRGRVDELERELVAKDERHVRQLAERSQLFVDKLEKHAEKLKKVQKKLTETQKELAETQKELAETREELAETQKELVKCDLTWTQMLMDKDEKKGKEIAEKDAVIKKIKNEQATASSNKDDDMQLDETE